MKMAGRGETVHLSLQAEKMLVLCLSAVPHPPQSLQLHPPTHLHPFAIIMYYCPLLRDRGCGAPKVSGMQWGGRRAGGLFTSEEARTIDGKPPATTGAPEGPHNTNISGDVFHRGEGGYDGGSLLGVNEGRWWGGPIGDGP